MPSTTTLTAPAPRRLAKRLALAASLSLGAGLLGCSNPTPPPAATAPAAVSPTPSESSSAVAPTPCTLSDTPLLGAVLPLSGPDAPRGAAMERGLRLAAEQVADFAFIGPETPLALRIEDGGTDAATAGEAVARLLEAGVSVIVGPVDGRGLLAAAPLAVASGVPLLVPSAAPLGAFGPGDGVLRVAPSEAAIARAAVSAVAPSERGEGVTLLSFGDRPQTRAAAEAMRTAAAEAQLGPITELAATTPEALAELLAGLQAAPPGLLLLADAPADHDLLLAALRRTPAQDTILVGGDAFNSARTAPGDNEGVVTADLWHRSSARPENDYFVADWREAYVDQPNADGVRAYSAVVLAAHAIRLACSNEPSAVRAGLAALREAATPLGSWTFSTDGGPRQSPAPLVWRAGERIPYVATAPPGP